MTPRGTVSYSSSRWRPALEWMRRGEFRMVRLNAVGWLALVAPGAVVGVVAWGLLVGSWWPASAVPGFVIVGLQRDTAAIDETLRRPSP